MPISLMDSRKPRVVVGVVGLLYALVGIFLSMVATLFFISLTVLALWFKGTPSWVLQSSIQRRQKKSPYLFNKSPRSVSTPSSFPSGSKTGKYHNSYRSCENTAASRTDSSPLPQYWPTEHGGNVTSDIKPTIITLPLINPQHIHDHTPLLQARRPPRISTSKAYINFAERSRPSFCLSNLRPPWGDKRPKIYRCVSSPHLTTSVCPFPLSREEKVSYIVMKKFKRLRKAPSVPNYLGSTPGKGFTCSRILVRKHSQPLRTQPYEAPYFFPTPVPKRDIPRRVRSTRTRTRPQSPRSLSLVPNLR
ncbi:hypothetical protein BDZ94DRAFT_26423 [Collybia nuda]|uniref:Uncharacterized protein n=1 Tax=Collybia nuda TaxID=64659 RepID=A0A9P6CRM7_9AGAR|nr:hypothetical protein BDZ94DRAFT_26423 [Collybia nuda]